MLRSARQLCSYFRSASRHAPSLGAGACYLALCLLYFWPSVRTDTVPLPLLNAYLVQDPVWPAPRVLPLARGANLLLGDLSGFYYPYLTFTIASLHAGVFPLWNPYLF